MKKFILVIVLLSVGLSSCKDNAEKKESQTRSQKSGQDENEKKYSSNFEKEIETDGLTTLYAAFNENSSEGIRISTNKSNGDNKFFLSEDKNFILVSKYKKIEKHFKLIQKDTLLTNEFTYAAIDPKSLEKKRIGNKDFILLSVREQFMGNAVTEVSVTFFMLDIDSFKSYTLLYSGEYSLRCSDECIDGEFSQNKDLDSKPEIKNALYQLADKSKWIYHPSQKELNKSYYKNYEQKWYTDNKTDNHLANGHSDIPEVIYSTYYKDDIFKFTGAVEDEGILENNRYKVVNFSRGNILGYDKSKQLYFPIYVESCVTGCGKTVEFISTNEIKVVYDECSEKEVSIINLDEVKF
ncbi:hypothetical protein [Flavobacterium aestivum]|uniref:hypothetical protein n=1 Tax=Flavobacterium aestivum TaxID=3003257 RepID=UPI002482C9F5|nr:hypothetical protein [Flavobacterium aestivum]